MVSSINEILKPLVYTLPKKARQNKEIKSNDCSVFLVY